MDGWWEQTDRRIGGQAQVTTTTVRPKRPRVRNESRNAKIYRLVKRSIVCMFNWWGRTSILELLQELGTMNVLSTFENGVRKIADVRALSAIFMCEVGNCIKKIQKMVVMIQPGTYVEWNVQPYIRIKFGDFTPQNESRNANRARIINRFIIRKLIRQNLHNRSRPRS